MTLNGKKITVHDMTLRDGMHPKRHLMTLEQMVSIATGLDQAGVPVLPIRFFDKNSPFFYFLGLINWRIRLLRLPSEVFNKRGRIQRIGIGELISPGELSHFPDLPSLGDFLRKKVYGMPLPEEFVPGNLV